MNEVEREEQGEFESKLNEGINLLNMGWEREGEREGGWKTEEQNQTDGIRRPKTKEKFIKNYNDNIEKQRREIKERNKTGVDRRLPVTAGGDKKIQKRISRRDRIQSHSRLHRGLKIGNKDLGSGKKILFIEVLIVMALILPADIIDFFDLTGIGIIVSWVFDGFAFVVMVGFLWYKGQRVSWSVGANFLEFIPFIDLLPIRIVTLLFTWLLTTEIGKNTLGNIAKVVDKFDKNPISKVVNRKK